MASTSKNRIIIDTDPGVDDVLALLLAFSASLEELEILLISVTHGNVSLQNCLKNTVSLFHVIEKEIEWRESRGEPAGYETFRRFRPIVAVGAENALNEKYSVKSTPHGQDGVQGAHKIHPHLSPDDSWKALFDDDFSGTHEDASFHRYFTPSRLPAHKEILRVLRQEPENTVKICVLGPMTNVALAAAEDPETFLRAKELVVMGGAVDCPGNVTPTAEFNIYADAPAAARVFALTSAVPASTMSLTLSTLPAYPAGISGGLKLSLFPLDITTKHPLKKGFFMEKVAPRMEQGSPVACWIHAMMSRLFETMARRTGPGVEPALALHDPLTVWYILTSENPGWKLAQNGPEDIRVESVGEWTRGMTVSDKRGLVQTGMANLDEAEISGIAIDPDVEDPGDPLGWISAKRGNRIYRYAASPDANGFASELLRRVLE
ncbi:inosine-uridine preferring nucleoside hydrolase [Annulohypoxylon moriforme]|nr:inosine-uridine preferring nucleoside hydrolase [Annulohypoxylon moriforme]